MQLKDNIIDLVVKQDLCIGCGLCAAVDSSIKMKWNQYGFWVANSDNQELKTETLKVCPFNPKPEKEVRTEDELSDLFLTDATRKNEKIGRYINTYVGYSTQHRLSSSSGGIATYVLTELLNRGIINHVISVKDSSGNNPHYEYAISSTEEEIIHSSKTKYYPVTLTEVLQKARELDGKIAITGVGCFAKGIRLLQHYNPYWKDKIAFVVGIICGGVKSRFFSEYLASRAGVDANEYYHPQFRVKDLQSTASDYSFSCEEKNGKVRKIKMRTVGDMWGTGMFKANACDFCDDVTTELADISLGDAWLNPYNQDGSGNNVIVTRSNLAEYILFEGKQNNQLVIQDLPVDRFISSQQGSFNHRHMSLKYRYLQMGGGVLPPKRHVTHNIPLDFRWVQHQRRIVRKKSLELWHKYPDANIFDAKMHTRKSWLYRLTMIYHYRKLVMKKLKW